MRSDKAHSILIMACISVISLFSSSNLSAQVPQTGILEAHRYQSCIKGPAKKRLYVYLPEDYYISNKSYPVIYFLHGANGNERSWIDKGKILSKIDSLTHLNEIPECIYVFPNTNKYYHELDYVGSRVKGSIESFYDINGSAEHSFIHDIIPYIDAKFRTIADSDHRAIAGLSLGGLQTLYITANTHESFGYIGLFSPVIYPPFYVGRYSYIYKDLEKKSAELFSNKTLLYMIMIGKDDPFYKSAYIYSEMLNQHSHHHTFICTSGGHSWTNWSDYSISFLKSLWNTY